MNQKPQLPGDLIGHKLDPPGPATWISKPWRHTIATLLNCLMSPQIQVVVDAGDGSGVSGQTYDAEIHMGPNGWTATIDLTSLMAGGGGANMVALRFKDDLGDCLRCRTWDGSTDGSADVFVAKQPTLWGSYASAIQNGTTYSFTYSLGSADTNGNHYLVRSTSGSDGSAATSDIEPPFIFNDLIYAQYLAVNLTLNGQVCTLMDTSPRAWAAR